MSSASAASEVGTERYGFITRFDGLAPGVSFARAIREGAQGLGIEIRADVHTGEIECTATRSTACPFTSAHGSSLRGRRGEVLVSRTVKDLVVGSGIEFDDPGAHELKGVPDTWRLYAVAG